MAKNNAPQPGTPPSFSGSYRDALQANLDMMPAMNAADIAGQRNSINQLGPDLINWQNESASSGARNQASLQQELGPGMATEAAKEQQMYDPIGSSVRSNVGTAINNDLAQGSNLDPMYRTQLEQSIRGAQAARGNTQGNAPANAEALYVGEGAQAMKQNRINNSLSYSGLQPVSSQFGRSAAPYNPMATPGYQPADPSVGTAGANFAATNYGNKLNYLSSTYNTSANAPNPWMQGLGLLVGGGTSLAGRALMPGVPR